MDDGEEVILKGSALYEYLHQTGFTNFESYKVKEENLRWLQPQEVNSRCMQITYPAPQWAMDHLNCILKCGLILEDHRHFIECYYPMHTQKDSPPLHNLILCGSPILFGGLWAFSKISSSRSLFFAALGTSSFFTLFCSNEALKRWSRSQAMSRLTLFLTGLEKVFIQLKRMLLLVHQNEFITQHVSLRQREMTELKKKLQEILLGAIQKLFNCLDEIKKVPLSIHVDGPLHSLSQNDFSDISDVKLGGTCSLDGLKKLFNTYILLQSEFLRRLALCYCPDIWSQLTPKAVLAYSKKHLPGIVKWSCNIQNTLVQEQRFFRAILESKDKQSHLKATSSSWDYSDVYVSVRSASIHFQSLLIQIQGLQDILEKKEYGQSKGNKELLETIAQILSEITKEIHSGQGCIDASSVLIYKMINALQPVAKVSEAEPTSLTTDDSEGLTASAVNPPVEDEVFELTVPKEEVPLSEDDDWDDMNAEYSTKKKKQGEASKIVFQELKTVLVKKAEEWKEREKRAMEIKGIAYTAPEQVKVPFRFQNEGEKEDISSHDDLLDFLPTNCQNVWPLPRLKGNFQTHRSRGKKTERSMAGSSVKNMAADTEKDEPAEQNQTSKLGFGASLLAEAMAKSKAMHNSRREDVFFGSDEEFSSGE